MMTGDQLDRALAELSMDGQGAARPFRYRAADYARSTAAAASSTRPSAASSISTRWRGFMS